MFQIYFKYFIIYIFIYIWGSGHVHAMAHVRRSKDIYGSVSFQYVGPRDQSQVVRLYGSCLYFLGQCILNLQLPVEASLSLD